MACVPFPPATPRLRSRNRNDQKTAHLKPHDRVSWNTPQGVTQSKVVRVISTHTTVDGRTVDASKSDPHCEVESDCQAIQR
ncbi:MULTISPECIES: hypervirulence associated TUDOR domain-containing protein [unclassified Paraburkholderia]|uniref:DUF2945 domain-containing protein n=1 Tax=unclassified Paraburkholderia TaxID=2615204 RepID=UPI002F750289